MRLLLFVYWVLYEPDSSQGVGGSAMDKTQSWPPGISRHREMSKVITTMNDRLSWGVREEHNWETSWSDQGSLHGGSNRGVSHVWACGRGVCVCVCLGVWRRKQILGKGISLWQPKSRRAWWATLRVVDLFKGHGKPYKSLRLDLYFIMSILAAVKKMD